MRRAYLMERNSEVFVVCFYKCSSDNNRKSNPLKGNFGGRIGDRFLTYVIETL